MKNNLDAAQNLAELINVIINSSEVVGKMDVIIENFKTITNVITEIAKSVDTINKKIDIKTFKQSSKNLSAVVSGVNEYIGGMIDVINSLKNPKYSITFDKEFQVSMLGVDYNLQRIADGTKDENTKESLNKDLEITKKSSVPQQIITFSNVIGELFKSFSKLGELATNPKSIINFKVGMTVLKGNITSLMDMMVSTFKSLAVDDKLKDVLDILVTEPETVIRNTKNITKYTNGKDAPPDTVFKSGDITKKGKQGLLDAITNTLNIVSMINGIPVPNMLFFRIKLKKSMKQITMLWGDLRDFIGDGSQFNPTAIDNLNKTFEGLMQTYGSIEEITKTALKVLSVFKKRHTRRLPKIMSVLFSTNPKDNSVLFIVGQAVSSTEFNNITKESTIEKFDNFAKIITKLKNMAVSISIMGALLVPLLLAILSIKVLKKTIDLILNTFNSDMLKDIEKSQNAINNFAILIGILSASILLLAITGIFVKESISSIFFVALYCVLVIGIFYLISRLIKELKDIKIEKEILYLSGVILSISMTVMLLALTGQLIKEEWKNFGIVALFFGVVVLSFIGLALAINLLKELEVTQSILYIAGAVFILSLTAMMLALTSRFIIAEWKNFGIVSLFLVGLIGAAMLLAWSTNWIKEAGKSLLYISLSVGILVLIMYLLVPISYLVNENWDNLLMTFALLGALVVAVIGVAFASKLIEKGVKPLILIAITMLIVSSSILILNEAGKNLSWGAFGMFAAVVGLLSGLAIGLGAPIVGEMAIFGAGVLIMIGSAFMIFASSLKTIVDSIKTLNGLNIDPKNDADKIKAPITILFDVLSYANGLDKNVVRTGKKRLRVLSSSMGYISNIAEVLQNIASLRLPTKFDKTGKPIGFREMTEDDFTNAGENIRTIITSIVTALSDKQLTENLLLLEPKAIENIGRVLSSMSGLKNIVEVVQQMAHMSVATAWNQEGKPIKFEKITEKQRADAITNAVTLMTEFLSGISSQTVINNLEDMNRRSRKALETVMSSCSGLKNLVDAVKEVSKYDNAKIITEVGKVSTFVTEYISVYSKITGENGIKSNKVSEERFEMFKDFIEETKKFTSIKSDALKANVDSFTTFVDKANSIDTDKIKTVKDMFAEMTELSKSMKGDFDKLADVLSDKLVVVLEKLQETISGIPTNVSVSQNTGSQNKSTNTLVPNPQSNQQTQVSTVQPQNNDKINKNLVDIKDSIDDMIALLTSVKNNTENYRGY